MCLLTVDSWPEAPERVWAVEPMHLDVGAEVADQTAEALADLADGIVARDRDLAGQIPLGRRRDDLEDLRHPRLDRPRRPSPASGRPTRAGRRSGGLRAGRPMGSRSPGRRNPSCRRPGRRSGWGSRRPSGSPALRAIGARQQSFMSARLATKTRSRVFHARPLSPTPSRKSADSVTLRNSLLTVPDSATKRRVFPAASIAQYEPYAQPKASRTVSIAASTVWSTSVTSTSASTTL